MMGSRSCALLLKQAAATWGAELAGGAAGAAGLHAAAAAAAAAAAPQTIVLGGARAATAASSQLPYASFHLGCGFSSRPAAALPRLGRAWSSRAEAGGAGSNSNPTGASNAPAAASSASSGVNPTGQATPEPVLRASRWPQTLPRPTGAPGVLGAAAAAPAAGTAAAPSQAAASAPDSPITWLGAQAVGLGAVPAAPKALGFAGTLPFLLLTPAVLEAVNFHKLAPMCAKAQVMYGCLIVSFLGAVHWGAAVNSWLAQTAASPQAAAQMSARLRWSVFPALCIWPVTMMDPGPASGMVAVMLGLCLLADHTFRDVFPAWYMSLRKWLTLLAVVPLLATMQYYLAKDVALAKQLLEEEERVLAERRRQEDEAAEQAAAEQQAQATQVATPAARKKGWFGR